MKALILTAVIFQTIVEVSLNTFGKRDVLLYLVPKVPVRDFVP